MKPSYCFEWEDVGSGPKRQLQVAFGDKSVAISHNSNIDDQLTEVWFWLDSATDCAKDTHDDGGVASVLPTSAGSNINDAACAQNTTNINSKHACLQKPTVPAFVAAAKPKSNADKIQMYFCEPDKPATASAVPRSYSLMNYGYADDFQHEAASDTEQFVLGFATRHTHGLSSQHRNCIIEMTLRVVQAWLRLKARGWYGAHEPDSFCKYLPLEYLLFKAAEYAGIIEFAAPKTKFKFPEAKSLKRLVLDAHWLVATNEAAIAVQTTPAHHAED